MSWADDNYQEPPNWAKEQVMKARQSVEAHEYDPGIGDQCKVCGLPWISVVHHLKESKE